MVTVVEEINVVMVLGVDVIDVPVDDPVLVLFCGVDWYRDKPLGPPHIVAGEPPQVIEQRPSVTGADPPIRALPQ